MATELHWVEGPWRGKLALAARPRGGDWLVDEMAAWREESVDTVVSLLEPEEESELGLSAEQDAVLTQGMEFQSIPIEDRRVPASRTAFAAKLEGLERELDCGRKLVVHCRQGVGRTGVVAACLLLGRGTTPEEALRRLSEARGLAMPETEEQRRWIEEFAEAAAPTR